MRVLVTSGATREPIDSVRFISNLSSGRTGAMICEALAARGFEVTQLHGLDSARAPRATHRAAFLDHASLDALLRTSLRDGDFDAVIHSAAVGDFTVAEAGDIKLPSGRELQLQLRPTTKIIDQIRDYAGDRPLTLVGFKLTHDTDAAAQKRAAQALLARANADYVVQNDVATLADGEGHVFTIHARGGGEWRCAGRRELATALALLLEPPRARSLA
jgi:phosphopantothenoylcysteine synthetase/decarboxylase